MLTEVDSGYLLATVGNPRNLCKTLAGTLSEPEFLGTLIVAPEGLNWSLCADCDALDAFVQTLAGLNLDGLIRNTRTPSAKAPFEKLKLRVRPELVTSGMNPTSLPDAAGTHIDPADFNVLVDAPGMRLIDVRNQYEIDIGAFDGAENPRTENFVDFAEFVEATLGSIDKSTPIALYCTGGIRCERASQLLLSKGFEQVFQLAGGILAYLKAVPPSEQRFVGECFVFDDRVSLTGTLEQGSYQLSGARIERKRDTQGLGDCKSGSSASHTLSLIND